MGKILKFSNWGNKEEEDEDDSSPSPRADNYYAEVVQQLPGI